MDAKSKQKVSDAKF